MIEKYVKKLEEKNNEQQKEIERLNILLEDEKLNKEIAQGHKKELQDIELQERKEIEKLNNIINKAIDFLKKNACIDEDVRYFCDDLRYDECKILLDILEGDDKE